MKINFEPNTKTFLLIVVVLVVGCTNNPAEKTKIVETVPEVDHIEHDLQIIDISQKQLALYNQLVNTDSAQRVKIFRDSLYYPYQDVWNGYIGRVETFDLVAEHYGIRKINELNEKNKSFYSGNNNGDLLGNFYKIKDGMRQLTGFSPKGKWYLLYGPANANLGGVGDGVMFIDFAFPENKDLESIIDWFPHELNHQIHNNLNKDTTHTVLGRCINEGFATYVNKLYWNNIEGNKEYSLAMSLSYSEGELKAAEQDWDYVLSIFKENYQSIDKDFIDKFGAQNLKLKESLPGKIGYLVGFRIVESYVSKHGSDSWKDIYKLSYEDVLEKSDIFKQ